MVSRQTALITGASRGLGLALARTLAQRDWRLIVDARDDNALRSVAEELAVMTDITALAGDVSDSRHRRALADAAMAAGCVRVVVNNASSLGATPLPALMEYPLGSLEGIFRTNVIAPLALLQELRPSLHPAARIINVTSDAGVEAYEGWGGYGASKAALEHVSAVLAVENPELRVYWVDPGDMRTQMQQDAFPGEDISDRPLPEESVPGFLEIIEGDLPSGRYTARSLTTVTSVSPGQVRDHS